MMNENSHPITADQARAELDIVNAAHQITADRMKPPLGLILLCSASLGLKTTAMGLQLSDPLWKGIQWGTYMICCLSVIAWVVTLRARGIALKISGVNISKAGIVSALLICALLVLSRTLYLQTGTVLYPCLAGALNALILTYILHFHVRLNEKSRGRNDA
jgi:hypothetical protein